MKYHDVLIIGSGLAGMRSVLEVYKERDVAILSKVHPVRSHSGAAQGGINAVMDMCIEKGDSIESHIYDTIKGSDYLADQDAVEILCSEAPLCIEELYKMGVIFSIEKGSIAQRDFGGASYPRCCYSSDRTGHVILHTLYEQLLKHRIKVYDEYYVISLIVNEDKKLHKKVCDGVVVYNLKDGIIEIIRAKAVIIATGGYGRVYKVTSNCYSNTGDGVAMVFKEGLPLKDMEFVQFHPTGLYGHGILLSEACRGEGGYLLNDLDERFMMKYAQKGELAPRDVVSRAIQTEINEGRGIKKYNSECVYLDLRHLGKEKIKERLSQVYDICLTFGIDCINERIPVQPTAHYSMGGIDVDINGKVSDIHGLYACGECACVSVHGANRLGGNSLLETIVFGKRTGTETLKYIDNEYNNVSHRLSTIESLIDYTRYNGRSSDESSDGSGNENVYNIRKLLQEVMTNKCGVYRDKKSLDLALKDIKKLKDRFKNVNINDNNLCFNNEVIDFYETKNLLDVAEAIVVSALLREESRGSHYRLDFPLRNDKDFLYHSVIKKCNIRGDVTYVKKEIVIKKYKPEKRSY